MINIETAKTILVPTDFTHVGTAALKHANLFAAKINKSITLLHVIATAGDKAKAMEKLEEIASANKSETGVETEYTTSIGTIFDQIGHVADVINAAFVVMGTHGMKGMQKITGSFALKVITKSHVPFVVVQKNPGPAEYKKIVIPISYQRESKQPLFSIRDIARLFDATCHLVYARSNDKQHDTNIKNNVAYAESFLEELNIKHESFSVGHHLNNFHEECLNYANNIKADIITLITEQNITMAEFLMRPAEQFFIANEPGIPVMCIHPDYKAVQYGSVFAN
ncbi:MAG: universal stress protein [Bacteroidia bacterium]